MAANHAARDPAAALLPEKVWASPFDFAAFEVVGGWSKGVVASLGGVQVWQDDLGGLVVSV